MIHPIKQHAALAEEIGRTLGNPGFHLWWLGQSGFALHYNNRLALLDPYLSDSLSRKYHGTNKPHVRMSELVIRPEVLSSLQLSVVSASHQHTDHLDPDTLKPLLAGQGLWVRLVAPAAWRELAAERAGISADDVVTMDQSTTAKVDEFEFIGVPAAHDTIEYDDSGRCKFLGYVVSFGKWRIYHGGDTVVYDGMIERLRSLAPIDIAILPINGKIGNMNGRDAARLAKDIGAKLVVPCHYDMFEFNTASPDEFIAECGRVGQAYRVLKQGERFSSAEIPS